MFPSLSSVLPEDMVDLADPTASSLTSATLHAIQSFIDHPHDPWVWHSRIQAMYNWRDVTKRTLKVYHLAREAPPRRMVDKMRRYSQCGSWAGKLWCCVIVCLYYFLSFIEWWRPASEVQIMPDVNLLNYAEQEIDKSDKK